MKQLTLLAIAAMLFVSCKKETPAQTDTTPITNYYKVAATSVYQSGGFWYGKLTITITNADLIGGITVNKVNNREAMQIWLPAVVNGNANKIFLAGVQNGFIGADDNFRIAISLKSGRVLVDDKIFIR